MATNTTNYGLIKPGYSDAADIEDINDNMEAIDNALDAKDRSLAVVNTGNTAEANIAKGELVYVRGHTTLADGLYQASEAITSGASLSGSNLTSTSVSDQYASFTTLQTQSISCPSVSYDSTTNLITVNLAKVGRVCTLTVITGRTKSLSANTTIATLPEGYRPTSVINIWEVTTEKRYSISPDGKFVTVSPQDSNKMVRLYATYVTA